VKKCLYTFLSGFSFDSLVSEKEIKELEQSYYLLYTQNNTTRQSHQQQITSQAFTNLLTTVLPSILIPGFFQAFDENRDGRRDFFIQIKIHLFALKDVLILKNLFVELVLLVEVRNLKDINVSRKFYK
jgi:hypothetical protein